MAPAAVPLRRHAWAKVNLYLEITGRRADGYHELDSLIVFVGLADHLEFRPSDSLELCCAGPFADAIYALAAEQVVVNGLITSRFELSEGLKALDKAGQSEQIKVVLCNK